MTVKAVRECGSGRGRFQLLSVIDGDFGGGTCCVGSGPCVHRFESPDEAVECFLENGWGYGEHQDEAPAGFDPAEALLSELGIVLDREQRRAVRIVSYVPRPGESRLLAAMILNAATGNVRTATVEETGTMSAA